MGRKLIVVTAAAMLLSATLACNLPGGDTPTDAPTTPPTEPAAPSPPPTLEPTAAIPQTLTPTAPPAADGTPTFTGLRFSGPLGGDDRVLPNGIERVYAVWEYSSMSATDTVTRTWYHDGAVWVEVEEAWDYETYGADGVISDVSIYDLDEGLPAGDWDVAFSINGVPQFTDENTTFRIEDTQTAGQVSPDGSKTASVVNGISLIVDDGEAFKAWDGTQLGGFDWFPDSQRIMVTLIDLESNVGGPGGPDTFLWVVDVTTGDSNEVQSEFSSLHAPRISPDGAWLAASLGNGYGDACFAGYTLVILPLAPDGQLTGDDIVWLHDYSGFSSDAWESAVPDDHTAPGQWIAAGTFEAGLLFTCVVEDDIDGLYHITPAAESVERVGDLP